VRAASLAGCAIGLYCDGGMSRSLGQEFAPIVRACGNHSLDQPRWRATPIWDVTSDHHSRSRHETDEHIRLYALCRL